MEKRIKLEQRGRPENEIKELTLDNCRSPNIAGLTEEFTALETLSLINVGLTNLKGFPKLPTLKRLELSDNRISNGLHHLKGSPKLTHLNLCGNKIKDYADLEPLKSFSNLEALDLFNNEVTNASDYREKIFSMIPSLKYLDGFDCNDVEAASSEGEGEDDDNFGDTDDEGEGADSEEDDVYEEEDVPLSEVYNEEFEEDNSDWNEGPDVDDEEDEDELSNESSASEDEENEVATESPARGKKRKHDG